MSDSFNKSVKARDCEFTTNKQDRPLIVQFAANNPDDLATATQFVQRYSDGIELNCGCPQRWAIQVNKQIKMLKCILLLYIFSNRKVLALL